MVSMYHFPQQRLIIFRFRFCTAHVLLLLLLPPSQTMTLQCSLIVMMMMMMMMIFPALANTTKSPTTTSRSSYTPTSPEPTKSSSSSVNSKRFGVCYDPYHALDEIDQRLERLDEVLHHDLEIISRHFTSVRTYQTLYGGTSVGPVAAKFGLRVTLGINLNHGPEALEADIRAAVAAAHDPRQYLAAIMVGNENVGKQDTAWFLMTTIRRIQHLVSGTGVVVGTVQRPNEILEHHGGIPHLTELMATCDIVGVNIYPYFSQLGHVDGHATAAHDDDDEQQQPNVEIEMLKAQWQQVTQRFRDTKFILTETGWPSRSGVNVYGNEASFERASGYYDAFRHSWFTRAYPGVNLRPDEVYYFQMFDQHYKHWNENEQSFGLMTRARGVKIDM